MAAFGEFREESIHSIERTPRSRAEGLVRSPVATLGSGSRDHVLTFATDHGTVLSEGDMANQFLVFQFGGTQDGPTILDTSEVTPTLKGNDANPDARAVVQLASFHVGTDEDLDKDTRATMRLDLGKDANSDSPLDTVFWSVAAGMNLYDDIKKKRAEAKDLKADFNEALSKRPVEIPGGLSRLSFEVIKHREPKWWHKVFAFLQSGTGQALTAAVGFPAITSQAVGFIDELLNRLEDSSPEILFKSRPMTLAMTERARDEFNGGATSSVVSVGVINSGFALLARGRDYKALVDNQAVYMGAYGLLKPKEMTLEEFLQSSASNPFNKLTYAVLRVKTQEAKLAF